MHVSDDDGIRTVTFDRPEVRNAFTPEAAGELAEILAESDPKSIDVVVLTGEGKAFSAGGDIESMAEREENVREAYERVRDTLSRVVHEVLSAPVPVVAKVNGDAVGAGMALVTAADFAYASESARFAASFINVGLIPDMGGTFLLPRLVGLRKAKELAFTGELILAAEADELDVVNEVVPDEQLDARVAELTDTLSKQPTHTIALGKQALHENLGKDWREALDYETMVQSQAYDMPAHKEGVSAFLEGRKPEFE
ncbi:Enoyl-CoA hydratase/carnithine racemase [Haladaptatus litoreus]|uniref:Enoyl-CoA hydratase/carnithine racemase n=1 Tax=Haladaptatus litoreus TaxID=553468 RepID=A0A1N6XXR4_9EURY|nr:enoyl-CoA hydratase-related protein [Haladaptatus litoreus]SIR07138.1 Enoyl-CoA hydratase/carnithine racemase [Haladaptatus litoreus]